MQNMAKNPEFKKPHIISKKLTAKEKIVKP